MGARPSGYYGAIEERGQVLVTLVQVCYCAAFQKKGTVTKQGAGMAQGSLNGCGGGRFVLGGHLGLYYGHLLFYVLQWQRQYTNEKGVAWELIRTPLNV